MDYFTEYLQDKIARAKAEVEALESHLAFHLEFRNRTPQPEGVLDVHTGHCCEFHKHCKYGDEGCPVMTGAKRASYPCSCDW